MINSFWIGSERPDLNAAVGAWCADQIGFSRDFQKPFVSLAVMDGENLIAALIYNNWNPETEVIEMHGAATDKRWMTRPVLIDMFAYPFDQVGAQMLIMRISEHNKTIRRLTAYGFREYVIPRLRGRNEAEVICTITEDDWRINEKKLKKRKGRADGRT